MPSYFEDMMSLLDDGATDVSDDTVRSFIERELRIIDKDNASQVIRFKFNELQRKYWENHTDYDYILKARKGGFSTLIMAEGFARACLLPNQQVIFLAHRQESANLIFKTMHRFYDGLSDAWKSRVNGGKKTAKSQSKSVIEFGGNNSQIIAMPASAPDALRGMTPTYVHMSESAFWKAEWAEDSISAILASIPPGGLARFETTPSNVSAHAYTEWHRSIVGDSRFKPFFFPWWEDPTNRIYAPKGGIIKGLSPEEMAYFGDNKIKDLSEDERRLILEHDLTVGQILWRRLKMREQGIRKFKREYPEDSEQCWTRAGATVFDMELVAAAFGGSEPYGDDELGLIIHESPIPGHTYVIGADPAGGNENGDFSAAICIDETTGNEAFSFLDRLPIHEFAEHLKEWGLRYGEACLAIERNNHGHAVIQYLTIEDLYPFLFQDDDGKTGILTTQRSKATMISVLDRFFTDKDFHFKSRNLYRQLSSYVYDERDRASGGQGSGVDDLVSATLCASFAMNTNHPKGIVTGAVEPIRPHAMPQQRVVNIQEAAQASMQQVMASFNLPFMAAENPFDRRGISLPNMGCQECGCLTSRLVGASWVCDDCGRVTPYAI